MRTATAVWEAAYDEAQGKSGHDLCVLRCGQQIGFAFAANELDDYRTEANRARAIRKARGLARSHGYRLLEFGLTSAPPPCE